MIRYFISKKAAKFLNLVTVPAMQKLASTDVITSHALEFKNLDRVNTPLDAAQLKRLKENGFTSQQQVNEKNALLGKDYEKVRSLYKKVTLRGTGQYSTITGRGVKLAVLDTGCGGIVPYDVGINFAGVSGVGDGVIGHGTAVAGIIKSSQIGMANGCELHFLKVFTDEEVLDVSAVFAAIDYCIDENIDALNMSFQVGGYSTPVDSLETALNAFRDNGGISFAATGNSTSVAEMAMPATFPSVVGINAVNESGAAVYKNYIPRAEVPNSHGPDFSCNGVNCEWLDVSGIVSGSNGTSFSSPWAMAAFAIYKEMLGHPSNATVLKRMKDKAMKQSDPILVRIPTF